MSSIYYILLKRSKFTSGKSAVFYLLLNTFTLCKIQCYRRIWWVQIWYRQSRISGENRRHKKIKQWMNEWVREREIETSSIHYLEVSPAQEIVSVGREHCNINTKVITIYNHSALTVILLTLAFHVLCFLSICWSSH